jgi:DNA-binding transcriptional MerR regulator
MNNSNKSKDAYMTIGEVANKLGLIDKKNGRLKTHTIRYWETQFKQIRPVLRAGKRRYYSPKDFDIIKSIKFLLKERGLTINGAKKILKNTNSSSIDDYKNISINRANLTTTKNIKQKIKNISKIIEDLKKYK